MSFNIFSKCELANNRSYDMLIIELLGVTLIYYFLSMNIVAQLFIVVDLHINQCKVSINLLAFSLLTNV